MRLPRHLQSAVPVLLLMLCLTACSSEKATPKSQSAASSSNTTHEMRQQLTQLHIQVIEIDQQIAQMRIQHAQSLDDLNQSAIELRRLANQVQSQLGSTGAPALVEESDSADRMIPAGSEDHPAESGEDSPSFIFRVLLVAVILLAVWFLARIFLGRMDDEDEFGDEVYMGSNVQERTAEGTIAMSPEVAKAAAENAGKVGPSPDSGEASPPDDPTSDAGDSPEKTDKS